MSNRRMFSKTIIDSDEFLEMPVSARLLYYDLGMRADDDGFVNPRRVMRINGASDDDLKILLAKKYVLNFENKVLVIRDWKINNFIRPDRYTPTIYREYLERLQISKTNQYQLESDRPLGIPDGNQEVYPNKGKLSKDNINTEKVGGEKSPHSKIYEENKKLIESKKTKYLDKKYDFPDSDNKFDWKYLLNHGKCNPAQYFGALYWKEKSDLSKGEFDYSFDNKETAWEVYMQESKNAKKLSEMLTIKDFLNIMETVDEKACVKGSYDFEWKLSTVLKNLQNKQ